MKYLLPITITIMALFAPLLLSAAEKNSDQHIKSIFFQKNESLEIVQIRLSEKVVPKIFELDGEKPRVVLDFIGTKYQPNKIRTIKAGGSLVSRIRVGLHDKPIAKTRVVIDMVEGMKYSYSKEYIAASTIFRITFKSPQVQIPVDQKKQAAFTEEVKKPEPPTSKVNEKRKIEPSDIKQKPQQRMEEKNAPEDESAVITSAQIIDKSVTIVEKKKEKKREEYRDDGKGETSLEEKNKEDVIAFKPDASREEKENTQILLDVNYEKNTNGNEMVLFHLNGFYPPVVYSAESSELLVVCDFLDAVLGPDEIPVISKGGSYIRQIKVEPYKQPKKVRVIIELADKYTYDVKQVFFKDENLFVIVLNSLGEKKKKK